MNYRCYWFATYTKHDNCTFYPYIVIVQNVPMDDKQEEAQIMIKFND